MATDAPKPMKLDALGSMLEGGPPEEAPTPGTVECQQCGYVIDDKTGEPVEPIEPA